MSSPNLIFLEGVSSLGKTTNSDKTFDYLKYIESCSLYKFKSNKNYIQSIYDCRLLVDIFDEILKCKESNTETCVFDRCWVSQVIYGILFEYNGQYIEPEQFKIEVEKIFNLEFISELRLTLENLFKLKSRLSLSKSISLNYYLPRDIDSVVETLTKRGTFENFENWNLKNYITNQKYLFELVYETTKLGNLIYVDRFIDNIHTT